MRIAIANNNIGATDILRTVVSSKPGYEIVWIASNGTEAVKNTAHNKPDLILMGLDLPVMGGLQAIQVIMKENPCAILIVTDEVSKHTAKVFEAMGKGALDAQSTPVIDSGGNIKGGEELLRKIAVIERLIGKEGMNGKNEQTVKKSAFKSHQSMIAIGSSTGGPKALTEIVSHIPDVVNMPVVIIQHVDIQFVDGLVDWLAGHTKLKVTLAKEGMTPEENTIYLAGTNDHLVIGDDLAFRYVAEPRDNPYRPSVDAFFMSVARHWPGQGVAVLLTGMGRDGAQGLLALRKAGWHTIAQDEKTSVVYGMPKAAAQIDAAKEILPIEKIADAVVKQIKNQGRLHDYP
ncbi:MAG: chemotaxis-specific protein-glutamate methyltransferase CheB [Proteobacteria bacterium]|nr:chemotaxis-specific protein-glutamate methyltransferase CheB [Pseudomonadota bacterium]